MLQPRSGLRPSSMQPASCSLALGSNLACISRGSRLISSGRVGTSIVVVRGSKDDLDNQLEQTQKTLDKVLQAVQAAQAVPQPPAPPTMMDYTLYNREQQLWDRQQAMLDRLQQQWDQDRQAWLEREKLLLSEISLLRQQLHQALLLNASAAPAPAVPASSVASSPAAAAAAAAPASPAVAYSSSRPGASAEPGAATISGPSSASAAVASALRAVRDNEEVVDGAAAAAAAAAVDAASKGSWEDLFGSSSSSSNAIDSISAAIAAVDQTDVLADMDLSVGGRGRRRVDLPAAASTSSSSSNGRHADSSSSSTTTSSSSPDEDSSSSSSSTHANAAPAPAPPAELPVEVAKGDPEGPPPLLSVGDDDIFWVSKLHSGLMLAGFYPSDEEVENWMFAEGTQSALLTFQACNDVPETGTADENTWRKLLGEEDYDVMYGHLSPSSGSGDTAAAPGAAAAAAAGAVAAASDVGMFEPHSISTSSSSSSRGSRKSDGWPVVMDMDGGREVHALQVSLCKAGFNCGDDDMRWWQFGSSTMDALKTFQACNGLPESGVCDERTWKALLGPEATPELLEEVRGDESMYEDDMAAPHEGAVWLLGEQRWSKPPAH